MEINTPAAATAHGYGYGLPLIIARYNVTGGYYEAMSVIPGDLSTRMHEIHIIDGEPRMFDSYGGHMAVTIH